MMSDCSSIRMQSTSCCFTSVSDIPSSVAAAHSPPCKGGVAAPSKNGPIPKRRGRGGQFGQMFRPEDCRRADHPVCGTSVASRLLIKAAATPPLQGGEWARPSFIHSLHNRHGVLPVHLRADLAAP